MHTINLKRVALMFSIFSFVSTDLILHNNTGTPSSYIQNKAQVLSLHLPHKFAQTAKIQVANLTERLLYMQIFGK